MTDDETAMAMNLRLFSETALTRAVRSAQIVPPVEPGRERSGQRETDLRARPARLVRRRELRLQTRDSHAPNEAFSILAPLMISPEGSRRAAPTRKCE